LSDLSQDCTVILSTHIVEDVAVLCPRFAVIFQGRLVAETTPTRSIQELNGMIYEGIVERSKMADFYKDYFVTQTVLYEGRNRTRICVKKGGPPEGFHPVKPTLEDSYFIITRHAQSAA
ncbi:ABC transporter ATP-binding protein, partial [bacterium]|nr:ABC transporter ATP-binding protein [bacterium]